MKKTSDPLRWKSSRLDNTEGTGEWAAAVAASRAAYEKESEFIHNATFLNPVRWADYRGRTRVALARQRIEYLEALLLQLDEV